MYRPDEMAFLTEQMRQEIKKNRPAYTDKEIKTITWDGVTDGRHQIPVDDAMLTRVSDTFVDFEKETIIKLVGIMSEMEEVFDTFEFSRMESRGIVVLIVTTLEGSPVILSISGNADGDGISYKEGVYMRSEGYIEYNAQTIHPIPAEYIPPLDRLILNGADGNQYALTITDGAISVAPVTT